jgi:H+/Cl- antiporter ClcA
VAQLAFDGTLALGTVGVLLVLKPLVTTGMLAAGANGGLLTPALATGALLGTLTGTAYSILWPGTPVAGFAMIGAAAVLATTLRAPLCAVVLLLEFTGTGLDLVVPMALAVAGAMYTSELLLRRCPAPAGR